jgi:hypothetical protein
MSSVGTNSDDKCAFPEPLENAVCATTSSVCAEQVGRCVSTNIVEDVCAEGPSDLCEVSDKTSFTGPRC